MKGRYSEGRKESFPGPGSYSPTSPGKNNYKFSLGSKTKTSAKHDIAPGPGEYNLRSSIGEDKKFSFSGRHKEVKNSDVPGMIIILIYIPYIFVIKGPGAYTIKSTIGESKSISISPRLSNKRKFTSSLHNLIAVRTSVTFPWSWCL